MGSDNTNRRTVETEFKKAMVRVNVPVGLLVTAFGIGLMVLVGSYLIKLSLIHISEPTRH